MAARVLLVDDDVRLCRALSQALEAGGFDTHVVTRGAEALRSLAGRDFDALVTDLHLGQGEADGLELCRKVLAAHPTLPVVVITGFGTVEAAVEALRVGAYDFLQKPFEPRQLILTLRRAIEQRGSRSSSPSGRPIPQKELIGSSPAMGGLVDLIDRVAPTNTAVLITGESGTGKELVARAIHRASQRSAGRFVAINCAAMPEALLESELFDHVRGAFTDAKVDRKGLFLEASGGTLFLDEIGELPLSMQPKLLRVLQERVVKPVGGDREEPHDARILAATNRDLDSEVVARRFREDLYYRVNVARISVPPLRDRGDDVMILAEEFLLRSAVQVGKKVITISPETAAKLKSYPWPGNVRELQNCVERAVTFTRSDTLSIDDLPDRVREFSDHPAPHESSTELLTMEEVEKRHILHVLRKVGGNKSAAASKLGIDRRTLHRKLEQYGSE